MPDVEPVTRATGEALFRDWIKEYFPTLRLEGRRKQKLKAAMALMADRDNAARDVAVQLGVSVSTLYAYVDAKGQPRERASELLAKRGTRSTAAG
jgi:hypothetical protein